MPKALWPAIVLFLGGGVKTDCKNPVFCYLMAMYNQTVMDHFQNPRNTGEIPDADGVGKVGSAECGDIMIMYIKVKDNRLADVKYKTFGCAAAIATGSIASEMLIGRTLEEAESLTSEEIAEALFGLPEKKMHCSLLAPDAVKAAIADYRSRFQT